MALSRPILITLLILIGIGCFTVSPSRLYSINRAFEYCNALDKDQHIDACDKLDCWQEFTILHYRLSHKTIQLYVKERIFYLVFKCRRDDQQSLQRITKNPK